MNYREWIVKHRHTLCTCWFYAAAVYLSYWLAWVHFRNGAHHDFFGAAALLEFRAYKPFQYRVLPAWIGYAVNGFLGYKNPAANLSVFVDIEAIGIIVTLVAYRRFLFPYLSNPICRALVPLLILYPMLVNYALMNQGYFPYDFLAIMFFVLGLLAIRDNNWIALYAIFIAGTFNRETTCFLTMAMLFTQWGKMKPRLLAGHCAAQLVIWVLIKVLLCMIFAANKTYTPPTISCVPECLRGVFLMSFFINISWIVNDMTWRIAIVFGGMWLPVLIGWPLIENQFVKRLLLLAFPIGIGMFLVADIGEVRIFSELLVIVTTAAILIVKQLFELEGVEACTARTAEASVTQ